jgi:hypothetical protein
MSRFSLSLSSKQRLHRWSALVAVFFLAPLGATYWNLHQRLVVEKCILYKDNHATIVTNNSNINSNINSKNNINSNTTAASATNDHSLGDGLACRGRGNRPYFVDTASFSQSPPGIARLVTILAKASASDSSNKNNKNSIREHLRKLELRKQENRAESSFYIYDYAEESWWFGSRKSASTAPASKRGAVEPKNEFDTAYGFRRNPNKESSSSGLFSFSSGSAATASVTPLATYFWLVLNVSLYGWYFYKKVDSGRVSMSGELLANGGDLGRAFSGNLAHFEIWHVGLNAMSLVSLGEALENEVSWIGGGVGLFLWTGSFLALVALGVVGLHSIDRTFGGGLWRKRGPLRFPRMVGFSGVLFAWSVAQTLSLSDYEQTCPVPLLSSLCFSTHKLAGGLRFSWGPIVQLVMVQMLLHKRVSFVGHLSGTICGFLWHWGVLPPLEFTQPCVLYPILWMACKSALHRWSGVWEAIAGGDAEEERGGFAATGGSYLGGGQMLGHNSGSRWTLSKAYQEDDDDDNENGHRHPSRKVLLLKALEKFAILHGLGMMHAYRRDDGFVLVNSMVLSELLLLLLFSLFVRAVSGNTSNMSTSNHNNGRVHPLASVGVLGRAYVAFVVVAFVTDSMALGGWCASFCFCETTPFFVSLLAVTRFALWILSAATVCHTLEAANELQVGSNNISGNISGSVSDGSNAGDGGIWAHVLGWSVAEPFASFGKALAEAHWETGPAVTAATVAGPKPRQGGSGSTGMVSGRSASNVAGKSRLVDRSVVSARNLV